ncbi:MAG: TIGR00266 family protein [Bacilli bacterium]|nr:TIGR00266 family protein [Bacilli bacterium]
MEYKIVGQTVPVVEIRLNQNESVYTQSGAMAYQTNNIEMNTNARGGVMKSLGRMFVGESIFMANYTSRGANEMVAFASTVPGMIVPVDLKKIPDGLLIQKNSFLCAEQSVNTKVAFTKRFGAGLFGGEGFILQKAEGNGTLFLEVDGDVIEKQLQPGEILKVDTGNIVAFENSVSYEIETVKGFGNILLGGEGLFLTKLVGPGKVILQSQNFKDFANRLIPYMPRNNNN